MITVTVSEFYDIAENWALKHHICPRCGKSDDVFYRSELSDIYLCNRCFLDEDEFLYENYDNWSIVVAVRALCATDIKIFREECL